MCTTLPAAPALTPFRQRAEAALRASGFAAPTAREARVLCFDSTPWWPLRESATALLPAREAQRAARFRHALDRDTYTMAHAFWRLALGLALDTDPQQVPLSYSPAGQPQLPGTGLATSLSHSGSRVAIAIGQAASLGVDIESYPPHANLHDLVDTVCTVAEARALAALADEARTQALLALWTRKEALLKAFGVGLRIAPSSIEAPLEQWITPPSELATAPRCRLVSLAASSGWIGSLALPDGVATHSLHSL